MLLLRRVSTAVAATAVLGALTIFGASSEASADTCTNARDVYIGGAESHYTLNCSNGNIYVDGRVKDTRSDGRCARVKALINGVWHYSDRACPNGTTRYFSWSGAGNTAYVYTYVE